MGLEPVQGRALLGDRSPNIFVFSCQTSTNSFCAIRVHIFYSILLEFIFMLLLIIFYLKQQFFSLSHPCRMLEYGEYKGHLYGTSVDAVQAVLDEGKICVMDLEPQVGLWWCISHLPKVMNACHPFYAHALGCS